jgi:hypothetical protein
VKKYARAREDFYARIPSRVFAALRAGDFTPAAASALTS